MQLGPAPLLAAASYAIDMTLHGCTYHGWRVAALAHRLAQVMAPDIAGDVLYAGLLHDAGAVGTDHLVGDRAVYQTDAVSSQILSHPKRGAALLQWLPGMGNAGIYVLTHHEWWNGSGYPSQMIGELIPLGGRILRMADAADAAGVFASAVNLSNAMNKLVRDTGYCWSRPMWGMLLDVLKDADFFRSLSQPLALTRLLTQLMTQHELPKELSAGDGIDRLFHIFAALVDVKDPKTAGHSLRTAKYATELAKQLKLTHEEVSTAYRAGMIHDCGKLGLPSDIINVGGRMDDTLIRVVRRHASMAIEAMSCLPDCPDMAELGNIAAHDHERFDGTGYPHGMAGESIPLLSRIISVADAYDAMTTPQDYRWLSPKAALVRLQQGAGTQFDPVIVEAMVNAVNMGQIAPGLSNAA